MIKIGTKVELLIDISDSEFDYNLPKGTIGEVNSYIEIPGADDLILFNPLGELRIYGIRAKSVKKVK